MSEAPQAAPIHLWIVAIIGLLWNAMGCFDYVMTQTENEAHMANFTEAQLEFFYSHPSWIVVAWAVAVFAGLLGSFLLLIRKKLAVPVLVISLIAMLMTSIHGYIIRDGLEVVGTAGAVFTAIIAVFCVFLVVYSRAMAARGVLR
jgi:hypothetical protein